ncbi:amidohydrolase family protein [Thermodesulfobacteriota bacterium]
MKIDMFTHLITPRFMDIISKRIPFPNGRPVPLWDLEQRFRIMDKFEDYVQVLTFPQPAIEAVAEHKDAVELARLGNDELSEIITRHPDRFIAGVANLPINDVEASLKETDRAIKDLGLKGILIHTNINGKPLDSPEFMPLYEKMAQYDLPIWIHPRRDNTVADYSTESESKYFIHGSLGWPYETQLAMTRLVCNGVLEKYPNLKFITHHCGGGIPFFGDRIAGFLNTFRKRDPDSSLGRLTKEPVEQLRMFYGDTAIGGSTPALDCGYAFFGAEHIIFGSDMPYGPEHGIGEAITAVTEMAISDSDKKKIFEDNARRLLGV